MERSRWPARPAGSRRSSRITIRLWTSVTGFFATRIRQTPFGIRSSALVKLSTTKRFGRRSWSGRRRVIFPGKLWRSVTKPSMRSWTWRELLEEQPSEMARLRYQCQPEPRKAHAEFHHNVYVILLDAKTAWHRSILRTNPKRDPAKPCVYVGMSGLPPEHRFENHKHGYKAAWVVEKYGVRLMPELYAHLNPMPYEAALQMELELADDLRNEGYTVTGGH